MKDRISQYGFIENSDYVLTFTRTGERQNVKVTDYHLSLDMAKELSMVERTPKGKQARQYSIECERCAKDPLAALNDPNVMRSDVCGAAQPKQ